MNPTTFGCGGMNRGASMPDMPLCAPLRQLKQEHLPLRKAMDIFYSTAERLFEGSGTERYDIFHTLRDQVADFTEQLKKHSRKEDDGLFPMMARYIGREVGPIAVMEYEHEQAEQHLLRFLDAADQDDSGIKVEDVKTITGYAVQAYSILTEHFSKEENVLFPMAENMLSLEEKEQLNNMIQEL